MSQLTWGEGKKLLFLRENVPTDNLYTLSQSVTTIKKFVCLNEKHEEEKKVKLKLNQII